MVTLANGGAWLVNGAEIIADGPKAQAELAAQQYQAQVGGFGLQMDGHELFRPRAHRG